ncbi:hypothetical protein [Bradyrhizobium sp. BRP23]|uniref:hypothetical protein n=1 Tax=Bradyrhizobium sp. BRP23 TaxID=2793820 RepID=UPI001CD306FD|nr:hypothetical protein [Bradyrhizobium sp. BRP23]MCA1419476.1 hypothetical protein [Bradyrhizobium sp. BRP23]
MNFETSKDPVSVTSDNGDALVPGTQARDAAAKEANETGKPVTIRHAVTDEVLATVKPETTRRTKQQAAANLKAAKAAAKEAKNVTKAKASKKPAAKKAAAKKVAKKATKKVAAAKKVTASKTAAPKREGADQPSGMTAELVKLALRPSGVTPAELNEHSKWKGAPWKWFFSNPKKTGVADRFGYKLKVERNGRAVTYFLTEK